MGNRVVYLPAYEAEVEYLESTGTQWIDTGVVASSELGIIAHIAVMKDNTTYLFGGADGLWTAEYGFMAVTGNNTSSFRFGSTTTDRSPLNTGVNYEFDNTSNHNILTVGDTTYQLQFNEFVSSFNFYLFAENRSGSSWKSAGVRIYDFKIYSGSTLVRDFIPVRIGTTGYMYDKVSRQLFANAGAGQFVLGNDVDNATAPQLRHVVYFGGQRCVGFEKVYERKEWLVARIYETTGVNPMCDLPINSDTFEFRVIMQSENLINIGHIKNPNYWYFSDALTNIKVWNTVNRTVDFTSNIGSNDMTFKSTSSEFTINNIQVTKYGFPAKYKTFFNNRPNGNATVYNSPITVNNKERYIPCTLTMDLPASMDANNIARTKGTSGMWDLVRDRFYGNVANRGTFKAVNLAEGVDYEVHQWLVAEIYPQTSMMSIPINSSTFSYIKENGNIWANLLHFVTSSYSYFTDNADMNVLSIWDNPNRVRVSSQIVGSTMEFNSTSQGLSVNNINITQYGFPVSYIAFSTAVGTSDIVTTKTSAINVDGVERYIPVKLLRSIPPRHDANGIARQAGECGMYDTVNDLFYGNVASSGVFSVSDD